MEDHSLAGYLERRSTEELKSMLTYYLQETHYRNYKYAIVEIQSILKSREDPEVFEVISQQISKIISQQEL